MINITKNIRLKTRLIKAVQLGILLLLVSVLTGCGNKGDLYHPSEQPDNQTVSHSMTVSDEQRHVSI